MARWPYHALLLETFPDPLGHVLPMQPTSSLRGPRFGLKQSPGSQEGYQWGVKSNDERKGIMMDGCEKQSGAERYAGDQETGRVSYCQRREKDDQLGESWSV